MRTADIISQRRNLLGLTLKELGNKVGVGASTVRKWETGYIESMRADKIDALAKALEVTPSYLMGWEDDVLAYRNTEPAGINLIPILGNIACGEPIFADEHIEGYAELDSRIHADFALRCKGNSMINARILDGDIVYIRQQQQVENGDIAAVLIDDEATLKRVYFYPNRIELRPENHEHPVLNYEGEDALQIRILGKAVAFLSPVK